ATKYGAHPVVRSFTEVTLFPFASGISMNAPQGWQGSVLIDTRPSSWSETGSLDGHIEFNKGTDIPGPLNIAVALTRDQEKRQQRIMIFGDGDFLSNSYLGNGGNLDFGMSLTNWLSQDDAYVNIPVQTTRDRQLNLSRPVQITIAVLFLIALPLALTASGVVIWLRRRKR
ncbi:MAG: ABC transporter, partial [Pseudomonadota bacterium]